MDKIWNRPHTHSHQDSILRVVVFLFRLGRGQGGGRAMTFRLKGPHKSGTERGILWFVPTHIPSCPTVDYHFGNRLTNFNERLLRCMHARGDIPLWAGFFF